MWSIHEFNCKLPKEAKQDLWQKECIDHPTSAYCNLYLRQYKFKILKDPFEGFLFNKIFLL